MDANGILLVMQTPKRGREDDHRAWYGSTHLPDVCAVPGVVRGEYLSCVAGESAPRWSNAAVYWLDRDPAEVLTEVFRRAGAGEMKLSDTLEPECTMMSIGEALTPRVRSVTTEDAPPEARQLFIVLTNATPGEDDSFNAWYNDTHLADVLSVPGFVAAQRFRLLDHPALKPYPFRYAALYEIAAKAAGAAFAELSARAGTERMVMSPALDTADVHALAFVPDALCRGSA